MNLMLQTMLPKGATVIPVLLGVDETHLSMISCTHAYPLYLSISNIAKKTQWTYSRSAYILLAFLPVLDSIGAEANQVRFLKAKCTLYHKCLEVVLARIKDVGTRHVAVNTSSNL